MLWREDMLAKREYSVFLHLLFKNLLAQDLESAAVPDYPLIKSVDIYRSRLGLCR